MKKYLNSFWKWYEKHTAVSTGISSILFTLQLVHLYWLTTAVVLLRLTGKIFFSSTPAFETVITFVDYLEIPAILTTSLIYLNELRKNFNFKSLWFLFFINSQWLHMFWITDEFAVEHFFRHQSGTILPVWLAWVAIAIDYLELPVIHDTLRRFFLALKKEGIIKALNEVKE